MPMPPKIAARSRCVAFTASHAAMRAPSE
jgi:hypothetical protein